jgi:hypothetical protein
MTLLGPATVMGLAARNNSAPDVLEQLSRDLVNLVNSRAGWQLRSWQVRDDGRTQRVSLMLMLMIARRGDRAWCSRRRFVIMYQPPVQGPLIR